MNWKYLLSDVDLGEEEVRAVANVVRSKWLSMGPRTEEFEGRFAEFLGVRHAVALSNCTAALHLALAALEIGPGDEVLVPSYTFVASANAILYQGATPVFVDIVGPEDLNLDPADLQRKVTPRTKAAIVVHIAGFPADMDRIMAIAEHHHLAVVEDACHAIGAEYQGGGIGFQPVTLSGNTDRLEAYPTVHVQRLGAKMERSPSASYRGRKAGTIGKMGCFSFFANKNLVTGEGGMLVTDDGDLAARVRLARSHGMTKSSWDKADGRASDYDVSQLGYNYRPTEFTAALGLVQLKKLPAANRKRLELVAAYRERLAGVADVTVPFADRLGDSAHHIFPILLRDASQRAAVRRRLAECGIQTSVHYPPVHLFTHYRTRFPQNGCLPRTEESAARELTLPLHPLLELTDIHSICATLHCSFLCGVKQPHCQDPGPSGG